MITKDQLIDISKEFDIYFSHELDKYSHLFCNKFKILEFPREMMEECMRLLFTRGKCAIIFHEDKLNDNYIKNNDIDIHDLMLYLFTVCDYEIAMYLEDGKGKIQKPVPATIKYGIPYLIKPTLEGFNIDVNKTYINGVNCVCWSFKNKYDMNPVVDHLQIMIKDLCYLLLQYKTLQRNSKLQLSLNGRMKNFINDKNDSDEINISDELNNLTLAKATIFESDINQTFSKPNQASTQELLNITQEINEQRDEISTYLGLESSFTPDKKERVITGEVEKNDNERDEYLRDYVIQLNQNIYNFYKTFGYQLNLIVVGKDLFESNKEDEENDFSSEEKEEKEE